MPRGREFANSSNDNGRSVREQTPIQDQLGKGHDAGWTVRGERDDDRSFQEGWKKLFQLHPGRNEGEKMGHRSSRHGRQRSAQSLAAFHRSLRRGRGIALVAAGVFIRGGRHRGDGAVIRRKNPGEYHHQDDGDAWEFRIHEGSLRRTTPLCKFAVRQHRRRVLRFGRRP